MQKIKNIIDFPHVVSFEDAGNYLRCFNPSPVEVSIPKDLALSESVTVEQTGEGQVTIVPESGVTLNGMGLKTIGQFAVLQIVKVDENVYTVIGGVS